MIETGSIFTHNGNGRKYLVLGKGQMQTEAGEWVPAVYYQCVEPGHATETVYARSLASFEDRFTYKETL